MIEGRQERSLSSNIFKDFEDSLKSGIILELIIYTKVPIKGQYALTYKLDYGRINSKWTEAYTKEVNKS